MSYEPALHVARGRCNVPGTETFYLELTYGASGPSSAKGQHLGVEDTDTGKITVSFPKTYRRLVNVEASWTTLAAGAVYFPVVLTNSIATAGTFANLGGYLVMETRTEAGTATNPPDGSKLSLKFVVTNDKLDDEGSITVTSP